MRKTEKFYENLSKYHVPKELIEAKVKEEYKSTISIGVKYDEIQNKLDKLEEDQMKLGNNYEKAWDKWNTANTKLENSLGDMKDMELEVAKENLTKSAQNIGVGVPPVAKKAAGVISAAIKAADDGWNTSNKVPAK